MGSLLVWGDVWSFAVTEYDWSCDLGIFRSWWPKVMSPYTDWKSFVEQLVSEWSRIHSTAKVELHTPCTCCAVSGTTHSTLFYSYMP